MLESILTLFCFIITHATRFIFILEKRHKCDEWIQYFHTRLLNWNKYVFILEINCTNLKHKFDILTTLCFINNTYVVSLGKSKRTSNEGYTTVSHFFFSFTHLFNTFITFRQLSQFYQCYTTFSHISHCCTTFSHIYQCYTILFTHLSVLHNFFSHFC